MRVLKIGHETIGARIKRVDHHLAVHRPRDLHPAIVKVRRHWIDLPRALPHRFSLGQKPGHLPFIDGLLANFALAKKFKPAGIEFDLKFDKKLQRFRSEDLPVLLTHGGKYLQTFWCFNSCHMSNSLTVVSPDMNLKVGSSP